MSNFLILLLISRAHARISMDSALKLKTTAQVSKVAFGI